MHSLCPDKKWITKLSSAGLVYYHFGQQVIAELTGQLADQQLVSTLYDKVYENFIEEVDAIDNGIDAYPEKPRLTADYIAFAANVEQNFDSIAEICC